MHKLKCIIIEDEPLAVKVLADYVAQVPFLELERSFKDALLATEWLRANEVQLIFLDIHLPKLKGMDFLRTLTQKPAVIITTAYHQYAIEGFNLDVTDYLLKPIEFERFLTAVNKIRSVNYKNHPGKVETETKDYFFLTTQKKRVKVLFTDIIYVESQREYVKVVTEKKTFTVRLSTYEIEDLLPGRMFKRVHRSYIISINKLESYTADSVELKGVTIPVGRGYRHVIEKL
ncbi:MAG: response regulator transcription factor [Chitinophagales bacterium]|nr:response regulator transcription factor [Chitinophagales bacterium]